MKETTKETFKEQRKTIYCEDVEITAIFLEKNKELLNRVRLETKDNGDMTYKPKKELKISSQIAGFNAVETEREEMTVAEFITNNEWLVQLNKNLENSPQVVTCTYQMVNRWDDIENKEIWNSYFMGWSWDSIYYLPFEDEDNTKLIDQQRWKERAEKKAKGEKLV